MDAAERWTLVEEGELVINQIFGRLSARFWFGEHRVVRFHVRLASVAAVLIAATVLMPTAAIAAMSCGNAGGSICCGSSYQLPVRWIYFSSWAVPASGSSTWQYYAMRYDDNNNVTYNVERPTGGNWTFDNSGFHGWRGTKIYRSNSPIMETSISQATNAATCFG